jgi:hydrogenase/urease accessory protein HupE
MSHLLFQLAVFLSINLIFIPPLVAHESRPAHLEVEIIEAHQLDIHWTRPIRDGRVLPLTPVFPQHCRLQGQVRVVELQAVVHESWQLHCGEEELIGEKISVNGLHLTISDVLLRFRDLEEREYFRILDRQSLEFEIPADDAVDMNVAPYYFRLGIEHILSGPDHLLFVLALLLLIKGIWRLLKTITAFTFAHSLTLAAAILGYVNLPSAPVEAIIALSIVFLARELLYKDEERLTLKLPWLIAAVFGLIHGLGFAGGLTEIGLPAGEIPIALLMFNLGVEVGQISFIIVTLLLFEFFRKLSYKAIPAVLEKSVGYVIGGVGAFWLVQRVQGFY